MRDRQAGRPLVYVCRAPADWLMDGLAPLDGRAEVVVDARPEAFADRAAAVDVVFAWPGARAVLEPAFAQATRLRWIHASGAGIDHLLFPALVHSRVILTNSRGLYSASVAEYAIALLLALAKLLPATIDDQREHRWCHRESRALRGLTMGVVGLGSIGREIAKRAKAFEMIVLGLRYRESSPPPGVARVYPREQLETLLERSDIVILTLPLTPETRGLIGAPELARMKPGALLINVARGELVDEAALADTLRAGHLAGAASDAFVQEPLPPTSPLYDVPNLLISPHMAANAVGWQREALALFVENFDRWVSGRRLKNVVDKQRGY